MGMDESFKKPGAVPFKWEIKPGVPKTQQQQHHSLPSSPLCDHSPELSSPPLRPPPPRSYSFVEPGNRSFRSVPSVRSDRWRFDPPLFVRPNSMPSGCFLSPLLRRLPSRKTGRRPVIEREYGSDLETLSQYSLSSNQSSPRPASHAGWDGFGPVVFSFVNEDSNLK